MFVAVTAALISLVGSSGAQSDHDELALYRAGRWFDLREIVSTQSPALIHGAVAAAFNDLRNAEQVLRGVIRSQPTSDDADDAYALLCRIYVMAGRYSTFVSTAHQWGAAFPNSSKFRDQRDTVERFSGRPDQIDEPPQRVIARHKRNAFTVPVTINDKTDDFLLDTGALTRS